MRISVLSSVLIIPFLFSGADARAENGDAGSSERARLHVSFPDENWQRVPSRDDEVIGQAMHITSGAQVVFSLYRSDGADAKSIAAHFAKSAASRTEPTPVQVSEDGMQAWFRFVLRRDDSIEVGKFHFRIIPGRPEYVLVTFGRWLVQHDVQMIKDLNSIIASSKIERVTETPKKGD